jgi:peptidoglycan/xylan/chitin deacetylase (PgdA/CDA1 family)
MPGPSLSTFGHRFSRALSRFVPTRPRLLLHQPPMVSFTFDDVPDSAYLNGAPLLEEQGLRGTFYIAPGICGTQDEHWRLISREQVAQLSRRGHEIGCHTYRHVPVQSMSPTELAAEDSRCQAALREICGDIPLVSFAFPFGNDGFVSKIVLQRRYTTCRGIRPGTNRGPVDYANLRVRELYDSSTEPAEIDRMFDNLMRRGGWMVLYTHDVTDHPSFIGCSPKLLAYAIKAAVSRGIACPPVGTAETMIR